MRSEKLLTHQDYDVGEKQSPKKNTIQLLVCDIDGTLIDRKGKISKENREAIAALGRNGIGFTLATGRMDRTARFYVQQLSVSLPIIANNGAVIRDCQSDKILSQTVMHDQDAAHVIEWLWERQIDFLCYTADDAYYPAYGTRVQYIIETNATLEENQIKPVSVTKLETTDLPDDTTGWVKIHAVCPDLQTVDEMKKMLDSETDCIGVRPGTTQVDVMASGVSKGQGLLQLSDLLGVDLASIAVIGDHDNDVPMFQVAGLAIAMGDGSQAAREASHVVTLPQDEAGVAEAIRRHILTERS